MLVCVLLALFSCSRAQTDVPVPPGVKGEQSSPIGALSERPAAREESVSFRSKDGVLLSGTLYGSGALVVLLAHQGTPGADGNTWRRFARAAAANGFAALAFDFRGKGKSSGTFRFSVLDQDVMEAVRFLKARGFKSIVGAGASMGGTAVLRAAEGAGFAGLIIFASTMTAGYDNDTLRLEDGLFPRLSPPKLFIGTKGDFVAVVDDLRRMHELSPEPKTLVLLSGDRHGTDALDGDSGSALAETLLEFLRSVTAESE